MPSRPRPALSALALVLAQALTAAVVSGQEPRAEADADAWRPLDPERSLYMELDGGRVVLELAPDFAPEHVANVETLVRERYFDGLAVIRSQDNYVVQWGDPTGERSRGSAAAALAAELERPISDALPFTPLPDADVYAPETGFTKGFPVARDPEAGRTWMVHCYGTVGVARGNDVNSGSGAQLYVVSGHAPRHLDRNTTLVGRVVQGMEHLSTLPRGSGNLGFYEEPEQPVPIRSVRLGSELTPDERAAIEIMRTDSDAFRARIEARRTRNEEWFVEPTGRIEVCNVGVPVRAAPDVAHPSTSPSGSPTSAR
jgi:peptidylprolyl isomerase